MAGFTDSFAESFTCPCNTGSTVSVQSFIGNNYFCESGNTGSITYTNTLYTFDPLWDGQGCISFESPCCNVTGIPWFHRDYGNTTTTDYIELRACADQGTTNEDAPVSYYEIIIIIIIIIITIIIIIIQQQQRQKQRKKKQKKKTKRNKKQTEKKINKIK